MSHHFAKPENALKRAEEMIAVGQKQGALNALHDLLTSKRHRQWQSVLESIMKKYIDLCVELRKNRLAKDGLIQYRMMYQSSNSTSLEEVIKYFIKVSEQYAADAERKVQNLTLDTEDLEGDDVSPESLLLEAFSGEEKNRSERELVTPWLKFLWDAYRTVLEVLRNNAKLEHLYQDAAVRAYGFCKKYQRPQEFRRLCELIRSHFANVNRHPNQKDPVNLSNPETVQLMLETRFQQLSVATDLELWQEAYRTVEDIHNLMNMSKNPVKGQLMAQYYQKLTKIFWVSKNYLFHAYAWYKLFILTKSQKKKLKDDELQLMASNVLLAALSVAQTDQKEGLLDLEISDIEKDNKLRMSALLGFSAGFPKLETLMGEITGKGILSHVMPSLTELYSILQEEFHPLDLCERLRPILETIASNPVLSQYVQPLQRLALLRTLQQLSQVYQVIKISEVKRLCYFAEFDEVEKFVVDMMRAGEIRVRIDHQNGSLNFMQVAQESSMMRSHLEDMSKRLTTATKMLRGPEEVKREEESKEEFCRKVFTEIARTLLQDQERMERRREVIEQRKEAHERAVLEYEREERQRSQQEAIRRAEEEAKRQKQEAEAREEERVAREMREREKEDLLRMAAELDRKKGGKASYEELEAKVVDLDKDKLIREQKEQLNRERAEFEKKMAGYAKKIDHTERACREVERPLLEQWYDVTRTKDREYWDTEQQQRVTSLKAQHQHELSEKSRFTSKGVVEEFMKFKQVIEKKKLQEFEVWKKEQIQVMRERRARDLENEKRRQIEAERMRALEEERLKRDEEERKKKEAEDAARMEEVRRAEDERRKADSWRRESAPQPMAAEPSPSTWRREAPSQPMAQEPSPSMWRREGPPAGAAAPVAPEERRPRIINSKLAAQKEAAPAPAESAPAPAEAPAPKKSGLAALAERTAQEPSRRDDGPASRPMFSRGGDRDGPRDGPRPGFGGDRGYGGDRDRGYGGGGDRGGDRDGPRGGGFGDRGDRGDRGYGGGGDRDGPRGGGFGDRGGDRGGYGGGAFGGDRGDRGGDRMDRGGMDRGGDRMDRGGMDRGGERPMFSRGGDRPAQGGWRSGGGAPSSDRPDRPDRAAPAESGDSEWKTVKKN
eukprot:TRINITY_DN2504_c0_g1::TRINITY_DN2504_c0_g1_i1::g.19223::m.19223 TRINITY_DN2504_c0_g1::TRINITY_DN2504_c0_g1_i1::g.19223  ORF type:complete len:1149 (-),score=422.51,sp/Q9LD55/EIF3A_ARATH/43.52/0.0,PCI/PF01399.22/1.4e+03,PCI/PF01399.22/1.1e-15,PCI/PF01399.22/1.5e+04,Apc5/PF12862.2/0.34 TRINITY_DN2504_c0_g1_i1:363-3722(-)